METVLTVLTRLLFLHLVKGSVTNVARNKPASMSSNYGSFNATTVVDGNTNAVWPNGIIHTATGQSFAWWKVDLEGEVQDATVQIYFRTDAKTRRYGVQIYTSTTPFSSYPEGQLCHTVIGFPNGSDIDDVVSVTCTGRWRYLLVFTNTDYDGYGPILDFGEVMVLVCSDGTYGENCSKTCNSRNCVSMATTCERDGRCPGGCQTGWTGEDCTQVCGTGTYGHNCTKLCPSRHCSVTSSSCDPVNGACTGGVCQAGWRGTDCAEVCSPGTYGSSCSHLCSARHCLNSVASCDATSGSCDGDCISGWWQADCTQVCQAGMYGVNCKNNCSSRHCLTPSSECDRQTGQCIGGCQEGWRGVDCAQVCQTGMYGVNCIKSCSSRHCVTTSSECDRQTGQCIGGCQEGWRGVDCTQASGGGAPINTNCGTVVGRVSEGGVPVTTVVGAVVGAVDGSVLMVVLVGIGIHLCLIRQGRLQWVKVTNKDKSNQNTDDNTQMRNLGQEHVSDTEHAHSSYAYNNDYAELNAETQTGNKDYDVIQQKL